MALRSGLRLFLSGLRFFGVKYNAADSTTARPSRLWRGLQPFRVKHNYLEWTTALQSKLWFFRFDYGFQSGLQPFGVDCSYSG